MSRTARLQRLERASGMNAEPTVFFTLVEERDGSVAMYSALGPNGILYPTEGETDEAFRSRAIEAARNAPAVW